MKYCPHCGAEIADDVRFCPTCGKETVVTATTADPVFDAQDIADHRILAMLGYLSMGVLPMLGCRDSAYAMHHVNQALWLYIGYILCALASSILAFTVIIPILGGIAVIVLVVFSIMGIVRALKGNGKPLPFIEKLPVIIK